MASYGQRVIMPSMAKIPMRVIAEPAQGTREVHVGRKRAGAMVVKGTEGSTSFLCGRCRAILLKSVGADETLVSGPEDERGNFPPLYSVREAVFKCKSCGAFNEVA
jgi:hypothetical protein